MLQKALKLVAVGAVVLAVLIVLLFQLYGLRVVLAGSGQPRLRFTIPNDAQAVVIARHREEQRAHDPAVPSAAEQPPRSRPCHQTQCNPRRRQHSSGLISAARAATAATTSAQSGRTGLPGV